MMSMSDLGENQMSRAAQENLDYLEHIYEAKMELKSLMYKTGAYAKNTATTFRDTYTPDSQKKTNYSKSPYGEKLQKSDYSRYLSPSPASKRSIKF